MPGAARRVPPATSVRCTPIARVLALADLAPVPVSAKRKNDNDGVTVLWKRPDVKEGLADLPWHRDCGMGGHALNCPGFVMTICLTDGSEAAGELRALPGSQHMTHPTIDGTEDDAPRGVSFAATAGDVSFHYSDVLHASMPPTSTEGPHRISVLLGFSPDGAGHHRGERHYNDVLLSRDDGLVSPPRRPRRPAPGRLAATRRRRTGRAGRRATRARSVSAARDRFGAEVIDDVGRADALRDVAPGVVHLQEVAPAPAVAGSPRCHESDTNSDTSPAAPSRITGGRPSYERSTSFMRSNGASRPER